MYSAVELARAAGYTIRDVPTGGVTESFDGPKMFLHIGPHATDHAIVRFAARHIVIPQKTHNELFGRRRGHLRQTGT